MLRQAGYQTVTPEQITAWRAGVLDLPHDALLLTFDDGRTDTVLNAAPILDRIGMRATVFAIGDAWRRSPLYEASPDDLRSLQQKGWSIEAHSSTPLGSVATPAGQEPAVPQRSPRRGRPARDVAAVPRARRGRVPQCAARRSEARAPARRGIRVAVRGLRRRHPHQRPARCRHQSRGGPSRLQPRLQRGRSDDVQPAHQEERPLRISRFESSRRSPRASSSTASSSRSPPPLRRSLMPRRAEWTRVVAPCPPRARSLRRRPPMPRRPRRPCRVPARPASRSCSRSRPPTRPRRRSARSRRTSRRSASSPPPGWRCSPTAASPTTPPTPSPPGSPPAARGSCPCWPTATMSPARCSPTAPAAEPRPAPWRRAPRARCPRPRARLARPAEEGPRGLSRLRARAARRARPARADHRDGAARAHPAGASHRRLRPARAGTPGQAARARLERARPAQRAGPGRVAAFWKKTLRTVLRAAPRSRILMGVPTWGWQWSAQNGAGAEQATQAQLFPKATETALQRRYGALVGDNAWVDPPLGAAQAADGPQRATSAVSRSGCAAASRPRAHRG